MTRILDVQGLYAGFGDICVLNDISLHVDLGEVVSIVGSNGAGKTTLLSTLAGLITPARGEVFFRGETMTLMPAYERPMHRLALVPEGGRLFAFMSVEENLQLGAYPKAARRSRDGRMEEMFGIFPRLKERRRQMAGQLSGGERQMCAIARAMMSQPALLMLDEPSVGLSPVMAEHVFEALRALVAREDLTVLLVEQNIGEALEISDRAYVLDHGAIVTEGRAADLQNNPQIQETYMGV